MTATYETSSFSVFDLARIRAYPLRSAPREIIRWDWTSQTLNQLDQLLTRGRRVSLSSRISNVLIGLLLSRDIAGVDPGLRDGIDSA